MAAAAAAARESWQAASPRRRRSAARRPKRRGAAAAAGTPGAEPEVEGGAVLRRIQEAKEDLVISDFWSSALETVSSCLQKHLEQLRAPEGPLSEALGHLHLDAPPVEADAAPGPVPEETLVPGTCCFKCVCYGVGNFASCAIARSQLAFLLLLLERCQTCVHPVHVGPQEGKRSVCGEPTVFYMPHCGTALYNNLLWRNWSVDALSKVVIIGNSFRGLEERLLTRILHKHYPYVAKILTGLEEVVFPQTPRYMDVFNDTSVHWFPVQKLTQLPTDTWAFQEEPDYQDCEDLEIIRKTTEEPRELT
ncbi:SRR1-like protein isoform X3 [Muntiacus reevesi]|uniref:SRR1-like protein isoform X3 n=1 Tax=Muntiacus reevesi TaxID=9886 RepID=UPI003307BE40